MKSDIPQTESACCYNCHFLICYQRQENKKRPHHISCDNRNKLLKATQKQEVHDIIGSESFLGCQKWVWEHHRRTKSPIHVAAILTEERGESCFFHQHTNGMSFDAATTLEAREADRREAERDRNLTRHALELSNRAFKISIVALIVSIAATCATLAWTIWAHYNPGSPPSP
jgi:hypothetical protein